MLKIVIMAGGKGVRFWPLSRSAKAKQFLSVLGPSTLIEQTLSRVSSLSKSVWILGSEKQKKFLKEATKAYSPFLFLEPEGRNTASCIGWAAWTFAQENPDDVVIFMPSDHWISPKKTFLKTLQLAVSSAKEQDKLVTLGIKPTSPHTGYGYIETEN